MATSNIRTNTIATKTQRVASTLHVTWPEKNQLRMRATLIMEALDNFGQRLGRGLWRMVMICIVLHVAEHFAPELRVMLPTVYDLMEGATMVLETIIRCGLRLIAALFQGRLFEVVPLNNQEISELLRQFGEWVTSL